MKTFALATALALAVSAPAFANDQLARSLGFEPGVFTTVELAQIAGLVEEGDSTNRHQIAALKARTGVVSTMSVDEKGLTAVDRALIAGLMEEGDSTNRHQIAAIKARAMGGTVSTQSVDANGFTLVERAQIAGLVEERDSTNRHQIARLLAR